MINFVKKLINRYREPELLESKEEEKKKKTNKEIIVMASCILGVTVMMLGSSYAVFSSIKKADKYNIVTTGNLEIEFNDSTEESLGNIINLNGAYPISDEEALKTTPYKFKITNTGTLPTAYTIKILYDTDMITEDNCSSNLLPKDKIKVSINGDTPFLLSSKAEEYIVESSKLNSGKSKTYSVQIWIDESSGNEVLGTHYHGKIRVDAVNTKETTASQLIEKANDSTVTTYTAGTQTEMYTFSHDAGLQQTGWTTEELTDYRYIGNTPNNYITFNDETWRIIGVFTTEDATGNKAQRVKIIRDESIGNYSWDNKNISTGAENDFGKNEWTDARLMKLLNPGYESETNGGSLYYNKTSGNCYAGSNNATTVCDFTTTGLKEVSRTKIDDVKWYLGGGSSPLGQSGPTYSAFERGTTVFTGRTISWSGKVGIMYPSDYAYTYALGVNDKCYTDTYNCGTGIPTSGWLFNSNDQCTLAPVSGTSNLAFYVDDSGFVYSNDVYGSSGVRPVLYLKSDISIASGDGSSTNPYVVE